MPKATKRERQHQNREIRRAAMLAAEKRRKRFRTARNLAFVLAPVVLLFVILQLTQGDDSASAQDKHFTATMATSKGTIVIDLDRSKAPVSVDNFVKLSRKGFYNGLEFNRVAKDFVIQTGSPDNTQGGGPGYSVKGEVPKPAKGKSAYPIGTVAFAKATAEPSGTAGSQFFIVTGSGGDSLSPDYALIGRVAQGLDVAQAIGQLYPASGDGPPTEKVTVTSITISKGAPSSKSTTSTTPASTTPASTTPAS